MLLLQVFLQKAKIHRAKGHMFVWLLHVKMGELPLIVWTTEDVGRREGLERLMVRRMDRWKEIRGMNGL